MDKRKEDLLRELESLGIKADGSKKRKTRSDKGDSRGFYKERSDKGQARGSYTKTAAKYKSIFEKMLKSHKVSTGTGEDNITRDNNLIFPPNLTRYYKKMHTKDREYMSSVVKPAHLEQARWRWFMAEYEEDPETWGPKISDWYFITEADIPNWTYYEWAWAYVYYISGDENRLTPDKKVLNYADYVSGKYNGRPEFDERGDIVWR